MRIVIFAGGSGRRLWPISLKSSPKQFEPIIGNRSTLQLAVERVIDLVGPGNIYISTNQNYVPLVRAQLPALPQANIIGEPTRRDLAAAVGLALVHLRHDGALDEPVAILWGDNYMDEVPRFQQVLRAAEQIVADEEARIVFMGETPRFANENLGWIELGERKGAVDGLTAYGFGSLTYRPPADVCDRIFAARTHVWNTGYFITTPRYVLDRYEQHQPALAAGLSTIERALDTPEYAAVLAATYPTLPEMSFDDAILTYVPQEDARVLHAEMGWSDPGTLYALKEAIQPDTTQNAVHGFVRVMDAEDCLLYNYEPDKLLAAVGLRGLVVVNTPESLLVVHKSQIPLVKKLVNEMVGSELDHYT